MLWPNCHCDVTICCDGFGVASKLELGGPDDFLTSVARRRQGLTQVLPIDATCELLARGHDAFGDDKAAREYLIEHGVVGII